MVDVVESAGQVAPAHEQSDLDGASRPDLLYRARLGWALLSRLARASVRAFLVGLLVMLPSLFLPSVAADTSLIVALVALGAAALVFFDYASTSPGLIEFSGAPPFNRIRFLAALATVALLTALAWADAASGGAPHALGAFAAALAHVQDFPLSPVWVIVESLPAATPPETAEALRRALALAYPLSLLAIAVFVWTIHVDRWPMHSGAFNIWVNLPNHTPRPGEDTAARLSREARSQILVGLLMPVSAGVLLKAAPALSLALPLGDPHAVIWLVTVWAILPAGIVMRGLALARLAELAAERKGRGEDTGGRA